MYKKLFVSVSTLFTYYADNCFLTIFFSMQNKHKKDAINNHVHIAVAVIPYLAHIQRGITKNSIRKCIK